MYMRKKIDALALEAIRKLTDGLCVLLSSFQFPHTRFGTTPRSIPYRLVHGRRTYQHDMTRRPGRPQHIHHFLQIGFVLIDRHMLL